MNTGRCTQLPRELMYESEPQAAKLGIVRFAGVRAAEGCGAETSNKAKSTALGIFMRTPNKIRAIEEESDRGA